MTRQEHLQFCKICNHQKFDNQQGIVCGLTNSIANFEVTCDSFDENHTIKEAVLAKKAENELENQLAGQGIRFANYLLDRIFLLIISVITGYLWGMILVVVSPNSLNSLESMGRLEEFFWGFVIGFFYYSFFEALTGRSLAKLITNTKVVDENGNKPTFEMILVRSLCRYIPFNAFSFLGSDAVGWHDSLSKTRVIKIK
ncbi:RDD family protein [Tenacibaculum tangerinum]|uniref:RDD family protein n=1 Tax=Tenacibaculum tangerinum TaxID=3038772 RepID=A0ABY8KYJ2_9FLAO|nr:RDD family protein [Tenacibaculum tangerinum]WGH74304.1 RDD family protein [Tenacibaculum tangerinum]